LHKAQLISYLKGYNKPLGLLANFGGNPLKYQIFPNKVSQLTVLEDSFDFEKYRNPDKERIRDLVCMCNRILITLGPGYFHQIYRRALFHELRSAGIEVEVIKKVTAEYHQQVVGSRDVYFFRVGDLLISAVAVDELTDKLLAKFRNYIKHLHCQRGFIINFRALHLDFRYYKA
jgi:GxxExxY protein